MAQTDRTPALEQGTENGARAKDGQQVNQGESPEDKCAKSWNPPRPGEGLRRLSLATKQVV
jgi:hypothetical protein